MIGIRFDSLILGIRFELRDLTAKSSVDLVVYLFHSCVELAFSTGLPTGIFHCQLSQIRHLKAIFGTIWQQKFITEQSYDIS